MSTRQRLTLETCPDRDRLHTPAPGGGHWPAGYLEWDRWAEKKAKTHRQTRCPTCGLWAVWVPKASQKRGSTP